MKKYQLLEKAMQDYPKGTNYISIHGRNIVSSGKFWIDGVGDVAESPSGSNVYGKSGQWAEIIKEEPKSKFVLRSEDGVDLFEGNKCFIPKKGVNWFLDTHSDSDCDEYEFTATDNGLFVNSETEKVFSTKEAAEVWIEEQNKPKLLTTISVNDYVQIIIDKEGFTLIETFSGRNQQVRTSVRGIQLEYMFKTYKSLQS